MSKITKIVAVAAAFGIVGMAALPMASYAALTDDVTVTVDVDGGLTISDGLDGGTATTNYFHDFGAASNATDSTGPASEDTTSSTPGDGPGTVTVFSNLAAGYTLTLADKDANTNLVSGANNIPTNATHGHGVGLTGEGWAVRVSTTPNVGTLGSRLAMPAAAPATPITLHDAAGVADSAGDEYNYAFSTSISAATLPGTYTDTVTFTLVAKS
ncbi:hypothetical protein FWH58_02500 [Candidatus Saccharibacteria bacterium]|nr:hypothetical protein [Candidatus Saccharibacteria bacterium]